MATRLMILAACMLVTVGCVGGDDPAGEGDAVLRSEDAARALRFVTVSDTAAPPCGADAVLDDTAGGAECLVLGPLSVNSSAIESASVVNENSVVAIAPVFTAAGIDEFNELSIACFELTEACATGRIAILSGDRLLTAPTIQAPTFVRDQIQVAGTFSADEAEEIVAVLNGDG